MSLLDLARDNLFDIICYVASDPSPRNVLWVRNIALSCKTLYELTKHPKVWCDLSKSWFQPEHAKNNRIEFIEEVFKYNFPIDENEYNFPIVIDFNDFCKHDFQPLITSLNLSSSTVKCVKCGLYTLCTNTKHFEYVANSNLTHAMRICMYRTETNEINKTPDDESKWLLDDNYYKKLAKNISYPTENVKQELRKHNIALVKFVEDFNNKIYDLTIELIEANYKLDLFNECGLLALLHDMFPIKHYTRHIKDSPMGKTIHLLKYVKNFAPNEISIGLLKSHAHNAFTTGRINMFIYMFDKSVIFLLDTILYWKVIRGYLNKGFNWIKSFVY